MRAPNPARHVGDLAFRGRGGAAARARLPLGSHADPVTGHEFRYWDGTAWTAWVSDRGITTADSLVHEPAAPIRLSAGGTDASVTAAPPATAGAAPLPGPAKNTPPLQDVTVPQEQPAPHIPHEDGTRTCDKCGNVGAMPYSFHYGKSTSISDRHTTTSFVPTYRRETTWIEHYQVGGMETSDLCGHCMLKARAKRAVKILVRESLGFLLIPLFYVAFLLFLGSATHWTGWFLAALGIPVIACGLIFLFNSKMDVGERQAIDLHRAALKKRGWDQFWTTREYAKLSRKKSRLPFG